MSAADLPLAGIRVLDLSRVLAGPVCTQLLADLGADVVKVERPGLGDDTRQWGPPFVDAEQSAYYLSCNRGKRSLALDLAHADCHDVLDELIRRADVLVENFLSDSLTRLGLTADRLAVLNPNLVSASISAFGRTGPGAHLPGYDLMIQAGSGLMSITGAADGEPMKVGVAISDVLTGLFTAASVLAGLVGRERGQGGKAFDLALADCTLASLVNVAQATLVTGQAPRRWGNAHPQIVPYEAFATADGHLALAIGADRQWQRFCAAINQHGWPSDPRFATNPQRVAHRRELIDLLRVELASRSTQAWQSILTQSDIPHSPVLRVDEALSGPTVAAREMVTDVVGADGTRYRLLGSPVHWRDEAPRRPTAPPRVGEHTREVLREWLSYAEAQITALCASGAASQR